MPQRLKPSPSNESNDLRNAGLKVTLPRLKILDILADESARHMSAEDIYKRLLVSNQDIGLATVYRVLTQFGFAATVIEVSPTTVVLQLGPEHGDQRITAVRGAIIRSIADLDAVDGDALPHAGAPSTPGARSGHRDQR